MHFGIQLRLDLATLRLTTTHPQANPNSNSCSSVSSSKTVVKTADKGERVMPVSGDISSDFCSSLRSDSSSNASTASDFSLHKEMMDPDDELVKRLRTDSPEQFISLVKMHLSFCLDQCTDEVDCLTPHQVSKTHDKPTHQRFGLSGHKKQKVAKQFSVEGGIKYSSQIYQLIEYLSRPTSLTQEGLFRRSGKIKQQHELMKLIKEKSKEEISQLLDSESYSVHEVATVLKNLLADMSEPLLVEAFYPFHCNLAKLNHPQRQIRGLQMLVLLLPKDNAEMLHQLLQLLHKVTLNAESNKMNALNLGTMMAPHILCPRKMSAEDLTTNASGLAQIVSFMIENANVLFDYPIEFLYDVRLHFKRDANEEDSSSTSSTPPVKTSITFVDREMTAKLVADGDPTEAALAELYAFVQSQPESEVKKKWVHKFNKENGCGTPKVILNSSVSEPHQSCSKISNGHGSSRNLSHSIRKHLFHGGGNGSMTPKRRRSKSSGRASAALCYSAETSPTSSLSCVPIEDGKSPKLKLFRGYSGSRPNVSEPSSPMQSSDFIRHPAYSKHTIRASVSTATPVSASSTTSTAIKNEPHSNLKENAIREDRVISPLTQSAQRLPLYVRDSIMTPRCRKPVFTFSPIDEPADDDLAPNVDLIHQLPPTPARPAVRVDVQPLSTLSEDAEPVDGASDSLVTSDSDVASDNGTDSLAIGSSDSEANGVSDSNTSPDCDCVAESVDSDARSVNGCVDSDTPSVIRSVDSDAASVTGYDDSDERSVNGFVDFEAHETFSSSSSKCAPVNESNAENLSSNDLLDNEAHTHEPDTPSKDHLESDASLTSPFKSYLKGREIQVCGDGSSSSGEEDSAAEDSLLDSVRPVTDSLMEFLDGNVRADDEEENNEIEGDRPSSGPNGRPLTKSIVFETSL